MIVKNVFTTPFGVHARAAIDPSTGEVLYGTDRAEIPTGAARILSEINALAFDPTDEIRTLKALQGATAGDCPVVVRIGVGPLLGEVPARVVSYAYYVKKALEETLLLTGQIGRIEVFSSAPKTLVFDRERVALSLGAFGLALRAIQAPARPLLRLSLASPVPEVPPLPVRLSEGLRGWLDGRLERYAETAREDLDYGREHAAGSMFGDLATDGALRVTIGGSNEGRFWAVRVAVREAARREGLPTCPALGLIFPALRVPWYSPTEYEPKIADTSDMEYVAREMEIAANPDRGGISGLRREAKVFRSLVGKFNYSGFRCALREKTHLSGLKALTEAREEGIEVAPEVFDLAR